MWIKVGLGNLAVHFHIAPRRLSCVTSGRSVSAQYANRATLLLIHDDAGLGEAYRFVGNNSLKAPLNLQRTANTRRRQRRIPMELILIIVVVVLLFGGGGYWGRRRGHW